MWCLLQLLLLSCVINLSKGDEVFDVTTVYNISRHCESVQYQDYDYESSLLTSRSSCYKEYKGRIHSRTNALGLRLYDEKNNGSYTESAGSKNVNITIDMNYPHISWETKNWKAVTGMTRFEKGIANYFDQHLKLELGYGDYYLYFTNGPSGVEYETIPFIFNYDNNNEWYFYETCSVHNPVCYYQLTIQNRDKTSITVCCSTIRDIVHAYPTQYITIDIEDNKIKMYVGQANPVLYLNHDWTDSNNELSNINYFSVAGEYSESYKPLLRYQVLSAEKENAELVSPLVFVEDNRQLCLVFVMSISSTPGFVTSPFGPFLQILAEDLHKTEHHLHYINNTNSKEVWGIHRVNITIDKAVVSPFKLKIRKVGPYTDVKITRIASCDTEGEEVQVLNPNTVQANKDANLPIYTVRSNFFPRAHKTNQTGKVEVCLNGGVSTTRGCACPPGFSGANCGNGCGRNRFGQDCGGVCSLRLQECGRLLLCTFYTGCSCAPGYKGDLCNTRCSPGQYGNNCSQQCGHCASGDPCDIFTGECEACEPGYHPPHCKQPNVYYAADPDVSSPDYGVINVSFDPSNYKTAYGPPVLYQIQFREKFGSWEIYSNKINPEIDITQKNGSISDSLLLPSNNVVMESIEGLIPGTVYEVRVLFMDDDFNKYDGELVGVSEILTNCYIPEEYNYKVNFVRDTSSLNFSWTYVKETENWCPITSYEVSWKEDWQWLKGDVEQETFSLTGILPGSAIRFKVRAQTSGGFAPYSKTVLAATRHNGTLKVRRLRRGASQSASIQVAWDAPTSSGDHPLQYTVTYKCVEQPACSPGCVNATEGALTQTETSLILSPLLPFARYQITVTPQDGQPSTIYAGTAKAAPTEVPAISAQPPLRSNTSLTVFWDPVPVCSSFLKGYNYQLAKEADRLKLLASGFTRNTSISFNNLTASTAYVVKVFIVTIAGWNPESFLDIHTSTSATVPEAVRNLTVYKRGRSMLGLRWAAPRATYGTLKSFTITHSLGAESVSHTVEPTPCVAWPDLYCHTVEGLRSNRKYNVTVSARNTDVAEDGEGSSASGVTKESTPLAPEQLRLVSSGTSSVEVEWRTPSLANGIVRSFLISVEETERFDQDSCCQVYPLVETPVKEDALTYEAVLTGLQPASTYYVSVSAKTVGIGPSQSLVVLTRPPNLPLASEDLPRLTFDVGVSTEKEGGWLLEEVKNQVNDTDTEVYLPLVKAHLLLLVSTDPLNEPTGVFDMQLDSLIRGYIKKQFYFCSEYNQGEDVTLSRDAGEYARDSQWGQCLLSTVEGVYQPAAVRVTEYNGVFNADILYFTQLQFDAL